MASTPAFPPAKKSLIGARQLSLLALIVHLPINGSLVHASRTGPVQFHATTAMAATEAVKIIVALVFAHAEASKSVAAVQTPSVVTESKEVDLSKIGTGPKRRTDLILRNAIFRPGWWQLGVPALSFIAQGRLAYIGMTNLSPPLYASAAQLKLLSTAVFAAIMLGRRFTALQCGALLLLCCGVAAVELGEQAGKGGHGSSDSEASKSQMAFISGLTAVAVQSLLSGMATTYFEIKLKGSAKTVRKAGDDLAENFWVRNIQLSICGVTFSLIMAAFSGALTDFWRGMNFLAWSVVCTQALGGLLVGLAIKYADNVARNFANACALVLNVAVAGLVLGYKQSPLALLGCALVISSTVIFSQAAPAANAAHASASRSGRPSWPVAATPALLLTVSRYSQLRFSRRWVFGGGLAMLLAAYFTGNRAFSSFADQKRHSLDSSMCRSGDCRFLVAAGLSGRGDDAQRQLLSVARLAKRLNRRLVLPNAAGPALSICLPLELDTHMDVSSLDSDAVSWHRFAEYASSRSLLGRRPLTARAVIASAKPGANTVPDVVDAAVPLTAIPEWPCLRSAALDVRAPMQLLRPGVQEVSGNPLAVSRHAEFTERALSTPAMRKAVDVVVLIWQTDLPLFLEEGESAPIAEIAAPVGIEDPRLGGAGVPMQQRFNWTQTAHEAVHALGRSAILVLDPDVPHAETCAKLAAEQLSKFPTLRHILVWQHPGETTSQLVRKVKSDHAAGLGSNQKQHAKFSALEDFAAKTFSRAARVKATAPFVDAARMILTLGSGVADFLTAKMAGEIPLLLIGTDGICSQQTDEVEAIIKEREVRFAPDPVMYFGNATELGSIVDLHEEDEDEE